MLSLYTKSALFATTMGMATSYQIVNVVSHGKQFDKYRTPIDENTEMTTLQKVGGGLLTLASLEALIPKEGLSIPVRIPRVSFARVIRTGGRESST